MQQEIRFCTSEDGVRVAYATHGQGLPIVKAANWVTHVEFDWNSPLWRHWWDELGRRHRVVRYDERGCGLSDREPRRLTMDAFLADLEAVVEAAGLDRFVLLGVSHGGALAVRYAVEHSDRVSHLVLCGSYARGRGKRDLSDQQREEADLLQSVVRVGWGRKDPRFRRLFTSMFVPGATDEQMTWFDELMHISVEADMAVRLRAAWAQIDVSDLLDKVAAPTLVAHARGDVAVPFEEGRLLATGIPDARLLPLDSPNHVLLESEPAWLVFTRELHAFLDVGEVRATADLEDLTDREAEVVRLVAAGLTNDQIADRLVLSVRTVERHLSNAYRKLGLVGRSARAAAAAMVSRHGPSGAAP